MKDTKEHKPGCLINVQCAVYHSDGVCPGPYGKCTCDQIKEPEPMTPKEHKKDCASLKLCTYPKHFFEGRYCNPCDCGADTPKPESQEREATEEEVAEALRNSGGFEGVIGDAEPQEKADFLQVGRTIECGHCHPEKFAEGLKQAEKLYLNYKCNCICHEIQWEKLIESFRCHYWDSVNTQGFDYWKKEDILKMFKFLLSQKSQEIQERVKETDRLCLKTDHAQGYKMGVGAACQEILEIIKEILGK